MECLKGNINEDFESLIRLFNGIDVQYVKEILNQILNKLDNHSVVDSKRFNNES